MNQTELIRAGEKYAEAYENDERAGIASDVLNAFYSGAYYGERVSGSYAGECAAALKELCRLKHEKRLAESLGPGSYRDKLLAEYEAGKEPAWAAAFAALSKNTTSTSLPVSAETRDQAAAASPVADTLAGSG